MVFCFLRASFLRFCSSYLNLPKSKILQTGGSALAATSTRSSPASLARARASGRPGSASPSGLVGLCSISFCWLTKSPRRTATASDADLAAPPASAGGSRSLRFQSTDDLFERKDFLLLAAEPPERDRRGLGFAASDHQEHGDLRQAVLADLVVDLFVGKIGLDPQTRARASRRDLPRIGIGIRRYG